MRDKKTAERGKVKGWSGGQEVLSWFNVVLKLVSHGSS